MAARSPQTPPATAAESGKPAPGGNGPSAASGTSTGSPGHTATASSSPAVTASSSPAVTASSSSAVTAERAAVPAGQGRGGGPGGPGGPGGSGGGGGPAGFGGPGPSGSRTVDRTIVEAVSFLSRNQQGSGAPAAPAASAAPADTVDLAIESLLGARPENGKDFATLLSRAFTPYERNGHIEMRYRRPSTAGVMMLSGGGVLTGAQATIVARATSARDEIFRQLDGLQPLTLVPDPDPVRDVRSLIHDVIDQVVAELAQPGGPNIDRVDQLLGELAGPQSVADTPLPVTLADPAGLLRRLQDVFGLFRGNISSLDDERTFTSFGAIVAEVAALCAGWISDRTFLDPFQGEQPFLGTQIVQIERSLTVVGQAVTETRRALERAEVERAEQSLPIRIPGQRSISLGSTLDWVEAFARTGGNRLRLGGQDGIESFATEADRLTAAVDALLPRKRSLNGGFSLTGRNSLPVVDSLTVLRDRVGETRDLARRLIGDLVLEGVANAVRTSPPQPDGAPLWPGFDLCLVVTGSGFSPTVDVVITDVNDDLLFEREGVAPESDDVLLLPFFGTDTMRTLTVTSFAGTERTLTITSGFEQEGK